MYLACDLCLFNKNNELLIFVIDLWHESQKQRKNRKKGASTGGLFSPDRRRKPVSVTGPYIVYMLKDGDIIEDWTAIKKVCVSSSRSYTQVSSSRLPFSYGLGDIN